MNLKSLKKNWEGLGKKDPFWAVLTVPSKINNRWSEKEFFKSGENWLNQTIKDLNLDKLFHFEAALDFGCGPGRLTQALCYHFNEVTGVDISSSMIEKAKALNRYPNKCQYLVNDNDNLNQLPQNHFDFVLSFITLQHIHPDYIYNYINAFKNVTKVGGYILFNLPTKPPQILDVLLKIIGSKGVNILRKIYYRKRDVIEMHWINESNMINFFSQIGLEIVEIKRDEGVGESWGSNFYLLQKK